MWVEGGTCGGARGGGGHLSRGWRIGVQGHELEWRARWGGEGIESLRGRVRGAGLEGRGVSALTMPWPCDSHMIRS